MQFYYFRGECFQLCRSIFNFNYICVALSHRYSLKGLSTPYFDNPPDSSPPEGKKKTPLISKEEM